MYPHNIPLLHLYFRPFPSFTINNYFKKERVAYDTPKKSGTEIKNHLEVCPSKGLFPLLLPAELPVFGGKSENRRLG